MAENKINDMEQPRNANMQKRSSRFNGLGEVIDTSIHEYEHTAALNPLGKYSVSSADLSKLSNDRTRQALIEILKKGIASSRENMSEDPEAPTDTSKMHADANQLIEQMKQDEENGPFPEHSPEEHEADKNADMAANILTSVLLRSSAESGIDPREVVHRQEVFGSNSIEEKKLDSFLKLCWEAVQDFVLIMLIVMGIITIIVETTAHDGPCTTCWIEGTAILFAVVIVVLVTAGIDYAKQFAFIRLTKSLHDTNTKAVIRNGKQCSIIDDDIVVGDILSVNSHNLASIPADCILLGPVSDLKMDESTLTGESKAIAKKPGDVILSGTNASEGSGKMVVIAVGVNSVAGKIKARVYESEDQDDDLDGDDENSPLFVKLDLIAKQIGMAGTVAALIALISSCIIGFAVEGEPAEMFLEYFVLSITVLAVAVPEGLPLAVTLALAFSSNKMMKEQNLVKHLDACETMGCATTICTDKTGTLTANKMTARALYASEENIVLSDPKVKLGHHIKATHSIPKDVKQLLATLISIDTMNETVLYYKGDGTLEGSQGNPTEVALLTLVHDMGFNYEEIRNTTKGRSSVGAFGEFLEKGKLIGFSSARKMMSWAVPLESGGYRIYCKGAQEVILSRCNRFVGHDGSAKEMPSEMQEQFSKVSQQYARRGMRCLALAYADLPDGFDLDKLSETVKNADGRDALEAETNLIALGLVGIEDPLRPEVPMAIEKCYRAGIDVRMVTGDNPNTAVSIAYHAGILRDFHFRDGTEEKVADNLKENVLMTGQDFRDAVYDETGDEHKKEFNQSHFDKIWPHLRVLARSSPDDKLTLAHGLNQSTLFADSETCAKLLKEDDIKIFPDRQVIAMTGDGTNDAPALKRADIGFAMGVAGTQIAKDAADIILLDDNFASIVTAAKWGRNVYASIQKFLQFQLTVNIAAVVTALVGSFYVQKSPLAAIQLLWVNLLMDALASLALASEPPIDSLLEKPPVNRSDSMITKRMWANMLGHATYQIVVVMVLLFEGPKILDIVDGHIVERELGKNSYHYTLIFNAFVWMQLFNEVNCRKLKGECNVFSGIQNNGLFCSILIITAVLQVLIVQFGREAFSVKTGGLDLEGWIISIALGAGSLPVQQIINITYMVGLKFNGFRVAKRRKRDASLAVRRNGNDSNAKKRE
mmetsp:Transcript_27761/g.67561  ORF Transcript_27761/g.67561 Transcript_27761/m.67561 type:complete len:1164 (+) Transcript_27761:242-3733(+)|eukprot:CAMPEP_0113650812 /NCGR_PEP_ID=MMETSP0017_2-20120614/27062_1 /TAXON_ID=2856 /ORGANISM="Cylindrotheca closterium" /LENGTH=1163 /DNA_ID=CAMNT_0000563397 /DNA_START=103 /DNA_END=3594 /DNA_ORIENTATION=+ /assembly_acc=CAM_ASM_000147